MLPKRGRRDARVRRVIASKRTHATKQEEGDLLTKLANDQAPDVQVNSKDEGDEAVA